MPLSETTLLNVAGDLVYARGEDYVRYVGGLRITEFKAYATIQAKSVYQVELDWSGPLPDGSCTCPHHADGNFCKHMVATGLAAIDTGRVAVDDVASNAADAALQAAVQAMDVDELRGLVMTIAQRDDGVRRMLDLRAATASGDDADTKAELAAHVRNVLAFCGFVDYQRSFEVAGAASAMFDELASYLGSGAVDVVVARGPGPRSVRRHSSPMEHCIDFEAPELTTVCELSVQRRHGAKSRRTRYCGCSRSFSKWTARLRAAGRDEDAVAWIDHAVAEGRVTSQHLTALPPAPSWSCSCSARVTSMVRGRPPTATARAGRGGSWPTEAPILGLSRRQTCNGLNSRTICGIPTASSVPTSPRHGHNGPTLRKGRLQRRFRVVHRVDPPGLR